MDNPGSKAVRIIVGFFLVALMLLGAVRLAGMRYDAGADPALTAQPAQAKQREP